MPAAQRYPAMRDALNATGRPIFYSLCNWGEEDTINWGPQVGNSWRTTQDIKDLWASIEMNFRYNYDGRAASGPGGWNDPDMLEVGNGGLTHDEEQTHFALWAVSKAPLIIGCDLSTISAESFTILTNQEIIAVNQDPGSAQARCFIGCGWWASILRTPSVYATTLSSGETVAVVVNWRETNYSRFEFSLFDIGIAPRGGKIQVRDLISHEDIGIFEDSDYSANVVVDKLRGHGSKVLKLSILN